MDLQTHALPAVLTTLAAGMVVAFALHNNRNVTPSVSASDQASGSDEEEEKEEKDVHYGEQMELSSKLANTQQTRRALQEKYQGVTKDFILVDDQKKIDELQLMEAKLQVALNSSAIKVA